MDPLDFKFWGLEEEEKQIERFCDHPACRSEGLYRAPKSRQKLNDYHYFCQEHAREYNSQWNYFEGYDVDDIEAEIRQNMAWDRPTWKSGVHPMFERNLRKKMYEHFKGEEIKFKFGGYDFETWEKEEKKTRQENFESKKTVPEMEALDVLGLEPPVELDTIKQKYKTLVKKYHPDANRSDPDAEEKIKKINAAYAVLKKAYEKYERIKE